MDLSCFLVTFEGRASEPIRGVPVKAHLRTAQFIVNGRPFKVFPQQLKTIPEDSSYPARQPGYYSVYIRPVALRLPVSKGFAMIKA